MGVNKNEQLRERHARVDRIIEQTTRALDRFDADSDDAGKFWPLAVVMGMATLSKSELDEPRDGTVTIDEDLLRGWVERIREACTHGGGGPAVALESLSELAYEFDESLSHVIDENLSSIRTEQTEPEVASIEDENPDVKFTRQEFNGEPGWKAERGPRQAVSKTKEQALDMLESVERHAGERKPEQRLTQKDIDTEAKRLYEISNQGPWDQLTEPLKNQWRGSAKRVLEGKE